MRRAPAGLIAAAVLLCVVAACTSTGVSASSSATAADACRQDQGPATVAYRRIPGEAPDATSLDVLPPDGTCQAPVVVWVHGGGYHLGDKGNQVADKVALFNGRGWVLVSVNYRLTRVDDPTSAHYPDHYEDVASALAWIDDNIERYGGDTERIALLGHSAGADIVANVVATGLDEGRVDCLAPLDTAGFDKPRASSVERRQWVDALGNEPDFLTATSATRLLRSGEAPPPPPTLTVYRGAPRRQDIERDYLAAVAQAGAPTVLVDARSLTHGEVNRRIGAAGDTVMTPPLVEFLRTCFAT
jgi:acetyl esterase/lipase